MSKHYFKQMCVCVCVLIVVSDCAKDGEDEGVFAVAVKKHDDAVPTGRRLSNDDVLSVFITKRVFSSGSAVWVAFSENGMKNHMAHAYFWETHGQKMEPLLSQQGRYVDFAFQARSNVRPNGLDCAALLVNKGRDDSDDFEVHTLMVGRPGLTWKAPSTRTASIAIGGCIGSGATIVVGGRNGTRGSSVVVHKPFTNPSPTPISQPAGVIDTFSQPPALAISEDGTVLVVGYSSQSIVEFALADAGPEHHMTQSIGLKRGRSPLESLVMSPDTTKLLAVVSTVYPFSVYVWNRGETAQAQKILDLEKHVRMIKSVAFTVESTSRVLIAGRQEKKKR